MTTSRGGIRDSRRFHQAQLFRRSRRPGSRRSWLHRIGPGRPATLEPRSRSPADPRGRHRGSGSSARYLSRPRAAAVSGGYPEGDSRRPGRRTTQRRSQGWRQCGGGGIQRGRHRRQIELPVRRRLKLRRRPQARGTRPGSSASVGRTDGPAPARRRSRAASPPRPRPRPSRRSASGRNRQARASSQPR